MASCSSFASCCSSPQDCPPLQHTAYRSLFRNMSIRWVRSSNQRCGARCLTGNPSHTLDTVHKIKALASHRKLAWLQRLYAKRLATWNVASLRFCTFWSARKGCSCRLLGLKLRSDHCRISVFLQSQRLDPSEVVTLTRSRASFCLMRPTPWQLHIAPCMTMARTYLWDCRLYKRYIISYYIMYVC